MSSSRDFFNFESESNFQLKKEFRKYLYFWKYFVASILLFSVFVFFYLRYSPKIYDSNAKIKVIDKKESTFEMLSASDLFKNSKINLENEMEIIKSIPILSEVAEKLDMQITVLGIGNITKNITNDYPFDIRIKQSDYDKVNGSYRISIIDDGFEIVSEHDDSKYLFKGTTSQNTKHILPFEIYNFNRKKYISSDEKGFQIKLRNTSQAVKYIKKHLELSKVGKESDIINLKFKSTNRDYSENILNTIIQVFNNDGVKDRQLIHKRTIDFVDERYKLLSQELDSIEIAKKAYKSSNDLINWSLNSEISALKSSESEETLFSTENQISLTELLIETLKSSEINLLPANLGIENEKINSLINDYNKSFLERKKLVTSAGANNPSLKQIDGVLIESKSNILFSLKSHLKQLQSLKKMFYNKFYKYENEISKLPEKEKVLRSIERNQQLKESLYLFLLEKREEAQISFAVTEPSIKVVEYSLTKEKPISPKRNIIFFIALAMAISIPFFVIYIIILLDTKIHISNDIKEFDDNLTVIGEIPYFDEDNRLFKNPNDRTGVSEAFRIVMSNLNYLFVNKNKCNVIGVTSSIKGEGKTLNAVNLALSYSSIGKKVLLIGCDLRNPQIHKYADNDKNVDGLINFLLDDKINIDEIKLRPFKSHQNLDVLLSGSTPPNPLKLLGNGNFDLLIQQERKKYDVIILDTAPTVLVADTKLLFDSCDVMICLVRSSYTEKELLKHIKELSMQINEKLAIILNSIGQENRYGYLYGYNYSYNYSYNYGYGYGYQADDDS